MILYESAPDLGWVLLVWVRCFLMFEILIDDN
jgi:hypothetical protein